MIKQYITTNFGIKIVCVILAVFFWYALKNEETVTKNIRVYISPKISDSMFLINIEPASVEVTISGSRKAIKDLGNFPVSVEIDLTKEADSKIIQNELKESDFSFPQSLNVMKIEPSNIKIEIDRLVTKFISIEAVTEGSVASNYDLGNIDLIPSRIKIEGPQKILESLQSVKTEKISIDGMNTNFIQEVRLTPPYTGFNSSQSVKAYIKINKSKEERLFDNIPIRVMQPTGMLNKCTVKPAEVSLKVSASTLDFQGINKDDFIAYVDINGLANGVYELPIVIVKKDVFIMLEIKPKTAEVTIGDRT